MKKDRSNSILGTFVFLGALALVGGDRHRVACSTSILILSTKAASATLFILPRPAACFHSLASFHSLARKHREVQGRCHHSHPRPPRPRHKGAWEQRKAWQKGRNERRSWDAKLLGARMARQLKSLDSDFCEYPLAKSNQSLLFLRVSTCGYGSVATPL